LRVPEATVHGGHRIAGVRHARRARLGLSPRPGTSAMLRRSYLFVPANRPRMLEHAGRSEADLIVLDLEDAIPLAEKVAAREALAAGMGALQAPAARALLRVNADPTLQEADLALAARLPLAGLVVPKVESPADLDRASRWIETRATRGSAHPLLLVALIETPRGVLSAAGLAPATSRVTALAFGAEDYRAAMQVGEADSGPLLEYARASVSTAAAAAGLDAIDSPTFDVHDTERLRQEARRARGFGFRAKFAIHPAQVGVIHEVMSPGPEERVWAQRVLDAYDAAARDGHGSAALDGRMIDAATVQRARAVLGDPR
jgi:citrate lyase beta subunit